MLAWCHPDGRIGTGWRLPTGALEIARGPRSAITTAVRDTCEHRRDGTPIVPGSRRAAPSWPQIIALASRIETLIDRG